MNKIIFYEKTLKDLGDGITNDISDWYGWLWLLIGLAMVAVFLYLIWLYYSLKNSGELLKENTKHYKPGSFKGFWGRYRGAIIVFGAATLLIIGVVFILMGLVGYDYMGLEQIS